MLTMTDLVTGKVVGQVADEAEGRRLAVVKNVNNFVLEQRTAVVIYDPRFMFYDKFEQLLDEPNPPIEVQPSYGDHDVYQTLHRR